MAEMINNSKVKVDEITKVTPFSDSPTAFTLPLTHLDMSWFNDLPVERLFFYQVTDLTSDLFNSVIVPKLKHSLSLTLLHYLPLAGKIKWPSDAAKPSVYYFPNDGVPVTIAVSDSDADFHLLSGNGIREAVEFHPLVAQLLISDDEAEVIAVQITLFPKEGFSIGITSHHAVLDGKSSTMFVKSWAYLCKQLLLSSHQEQSYPCLSSELTPFYDRTVIKDMGKCFNKRSLKVLPVSRSLDVNKLVRATFELTREDIKKLRDKVNEISEAMKRSKQLNLSNFVVTLAYVFVCIVKAKIGGGNGCSETVLFGFTADYRSRLDPPVPANYFGNCVGKHGDGAKASDVTQENGFAFAAEMLSDCVRRIDADIAEGSDNNQKTVKLLEEVRQGAVLLSVAGSTRLDVYGSDFGWGRPKKVEVVSIDQTKAVSLAETRDGGGGVEIGVALEKREMNVFASLFADGLEK